MKRGKKRIDNNKQAGLIALRYLFLLIISWLFFFSDIAYKVLLLLTIYPLNFILNLFYTSNIVGNFIYLNNSKEAFILEIIPACVAVSAFFLLLALNILTSISLRKRIYSIIFSLLALLIINTLRIFILSILIVNHNSYYDIVHKTLWYVLSIAIVIGIWFLTVRIFKIKSIPAYTDIKFLLSNYSKTK